MQSATSTERVHPPTRWRTFLEATAVVVAVEIALHSFIVTEPALTLLGAVLWVGTGVFWTRRGGRGGPLALGLLAAFEIVATLFFTEEFAGDAVVPTWILAVHVGLVAAALFAVVMTILDERREG